jgi:RsmE family RNA methyltransferase
VRNIVFFKAAKSEKSYLTSKVFDEGEAFNSLIDGLSQSNCYYRLPKFELCAYNPADRFHENDFGRFSKFILDLESSEDFLTYFKQEKINFNHPILLAIGPERGWINEDIAPFKKAGFRSVKISSSVLRVEHAIYSAVSQLELIRKQF